MFILNHDRPPAQHARFFPVILSHAGEFSKGATDFLKFIQEALMRSISRATARHDGVSAKTLCCNFNERLKNRVIRCLALGTVDTMRFAGRICHVTRSRY